MSYKIEWHPKASKNVERLPKEQQNRVLEKLDLVKEEPFRYLERFSHPHYYKLRIGDYRALIDVNFEDKTLFVKVFDHRGSIY